MSESIDFKNRDEFDESDRELCPDGNCTGLIGIDGKCKVCGLALDGSRAGADFHQRAADSDTSDDASDASDGGERADTAGPSALEVDGDEDRQLCPDGNCIGLLGSDGKCKVCGRSLAS